MAVTMHRIHTAPPRTLRGSAEAFLDTIRSPNTRRAYSIAIVKTVDRLDHRARYGMGVPVVIAENPTKFGMPTGSR